MPRPVKLNDPQRVPTPLRFTVNDTPPALRQWYRDLRYAGIPRFEANLLVAGAASVSGATVAIQWPRSNPDPLAS